MEGWNTGDNSVKQPINPNEKNFFMLFLLDIFWFILLWWCFLREVNKSVFRRIFLTSNRRLNVWVSTSGFVRKIHLNVNQSLLFLRKMTSNIVNVH